MRLPLFGLFLLALFSRVFFTQLTLPDGGWDGFFLGSELGQISKNIAEGRGFSSPLEDGTVPTAWFSPFMPYVWAAVFKCFGVYSDLSLTVILAIQALLGALVAVCYALLIHEVGRLVPTCSRRGLWLLSVVVALWPQSLFLHAFPWYFVYQELAVVLMCLLGLRMLYSPFQFRPLLLGGITGFALLVNPVPVLFFGWILFLHALRGLREKRFQFAAYLVAVGTCAVMMLPWVVRNALVLDAFIPMRSVLPIELRQGNNPQGSIVQSAQSLHPALLEEERIRFDAMGEIAYCEFCKEEAIAYIRQHPGTTLRRILSRVYVYWCTDLTDRWGWGGELRWWEQGTKHLLLRGAKITCSILPLAFLLFMVVRGPAWRVPGAWLWFGILVFLPLPYYLTQVVALYPNWMKPYVVIWGGLAWLVARNNRST